MLKHAGEEAARALAACMLRVSLTPTQLIGVLAVTLIIGIVIGILGTNVYMKNRYRNIMGR
jgi:phage-related minor tail protein